MGGTIVIKINGKKVDKVKTEQQIEVDIPNDSVRLQVSQSGIRSNELEVSDGERIEITTPKWSSLILFLLVILPSLLNLYLIINLALWVLLFILLL